jgi:hypothetical protein
MDVYSRNLNAKNLSIWNIGELKNYEAEKSNDIWTSSGTN